MEIRLTLHAQTRATAEDISEQEIHDVLLRGTTIAAKYDRQGKALTYDYDQEKRGRWYRHRRIEAYFVEEGDTLVVITVRAKYGRWVEAQ